MSLAPSFDAEDDAGFSRVDIAAVARRQLTVSLGLVAALALATGVAAFSMKPSASPAVAAKPAPAATQQMVKAPFFVRG